MITVTPVARHAPDQRDAGLGFGGCEAGEHLVEEEQARAGGEGAGHLQAALLGGRQFAGHRLGAVGQLDALQGVQGGAAGGRGGGVAGERADRDVLQDVHRVEGAWHLEGACDAPAAALGRRQPGDVGPLEQDAPLAWAVDTRDQVEQGRFAGPVRTDQPQDLAPAHVEGHVAVGDEAAEGQRHGVDAQDRVARVRAHGFTPPRCARRAYA